MVYVFGQFLDHDLDLTDTSSPSEPFPVSVPPGDPFFDPAGTGTQIIPLSRSSYDPQSGTSLDNPRQQINRITAWLDGSQIYGSDEARALALRTLEGGRLKTSEGDLLPFNTLGLANDNATGLPPETLFVAGDVRANENIELTAMHTLFVREHNRLADRLARENRGWSDEQIYQQARKLVIAELQNITYNEFLPALLGDRLDRYRGYDPRVNPGVANEFSAAAFRLGHSLLGNDVEFLDNFGEEVAEELPLREAFFNPGAVSETGIDPILKYLASDPAQELDNHIVGDVRNFLFGPPGAGGFDLSSLNIQRGRDHGLSDYNAVREAYGLRPVRSFAEITSDADLQQKLAEAYGSVDNIDLWVGGLAEDHVRGGSLGPLFTRIVADQFERVRDGDRFWFERSLSDHELRMVRDTTLSDIISRNTTVWNLQDNVFEFFNAIEGRVFFDADGDGRQGRREFGLGGITVNLEDADGNVIATAVTARDGSYAFEDLELGRYRVEIVLPSALRPTARSAYSIDLTRAEEYAGIDFGVRLRSVRQDPAANDAVMSDVASTDLLDPLDASA
jgi:hypothetical protein